MSRAEAIDQYHVALKAGQKCYRECVSRGSFPLLQVLDDLLGDTSAAGRMELGLIDIPVDLITGTCYAGRQNAFASNYMPLLPSDTEFAMKWIRLCESALEIGVRDPVSCVEYMGKFYIQEGNKRVSVQKSLGALSISAKVTRLLPADNGDEAVKIYYEFVQFHKCSGLYWVYFDKPGCFARLQNALGYDADYVWTEEERRNFSGGLFRFRWALDRLNKDSSILPLSSALLIWLQMFSMEELLKMEESELDKSIRNIWPEVEAQKQREAIALSTDPKKPSVNLLNRLLLPSHLKMAIIHEAQYEDGDWLRSHDEGWSYMETCLGKDVECRRYLVPEGGSSEEVMNQAIEEGATVLFTTTVNMITACRKVAAKNRNIRILNCSVSMPYPGVRTYYSRIYEAKFVSGAIAGALAKNGVIGYVEENPLYGVPASINAFALGAQMTHPGARIMLKWHCNSERPLHELLDMGVDVISNVDTINPDLSKTQGGLLVKRKDGSLESVASPYWNWGNFYIQIVSSILRGGWDEPNAAAAQAVNYWWGMNCGVVGIRLSPNLPDGVHQLARILRRGIGNGSISPFHCRLYDQNGTQHSDGHRWFGPDELLHMNWLCDNVEGTIPTYDELLPMARQIVRLQGVYRDQIPLEKDEFIP
ncbi:MAG: BMP family ABC transporter substrate-binding protein [Clostridiales bacterium]|nr:BMP family ABC transporter substrate-binding protein [Clostridiales bacterium]